MKYKSKKFPIIIPAILLTSLLLASQASAQGGAMQCDAKTLSFYPLSSIEPLFVAPIVTFGLNSTKNSAYSGTCTFALASDGNAFLSALASEHASLDAANLAFQSYKESMRNPPEMTDGACDRYINIKGANDSAAFQAQKGSYIFRAAASLKAKVGTAKLMAIINHACDQVPGPKSSPDAPAPATPMSNTPAAKDLKPILYAILGLAVLLALIIGVKKVRGARKPPTV